jgi:DNA-binding CsgD family transcriptional regulator
MTQLALIGRADELELARGMLRRARDGTPGVLLLGGEAGVGRSRLAAAIAAEAVASGVRVATGTCVRMDEGALTYAAVITALRTLVAEADPAEVARTLGMHRHQVARLLPELARPVPDSPPPAEDSMARLRLFEAVTGWLNRMAEGDPVLLVVEDLQWADAATLDLLRALALGLTGRSALVVTLRTDEALPSAVRETVAELVRGGAERVELVPFGRDELADLAAAARAGAYEVDDEALDALLERTGGNPFLARELIDAGLLEPGAPAGVVPASLRDILDARIGALDEPVLEVLRAAAMQPGPIDDDLLAAVLGRPVGVVGSALRLARESGVLTAADGVHAFRHALQAEVLIDQLGSGERRALHAAYADALAGTRGPARATAAAWHRDAAGDPAGALAAHVAATNATMTAAAFEAASRHAARAAELRSELPPDTAPGLPDRVALLDRAAFAALLGGDPAASARLARAALGEVRDDPARAAKLHDRLRWALWEAGDRAGAAAEVERAAAALGDGADPHLRALLTAQRAAMHMDDADPRPALDLAGEALGLSVAIGAQDVEALALGVRGRTLATHGDLDAGLADIRAGIELADAMGNLHGQLVGVATVATILARWGRSREALADIDGALLAADAAGLGRSLGAPLLAQAARASFSIGDWDAAAERIDAGLGRRPAAAVEAELRAVALRLAVARGRHTEAATLDARLAVLAPVIGDAESAAAVRVARAEAAIATGSPQSAWALFDAQLTARAAGIESGPSAAWLAALAIGAAVDAALDARGTRDTDGENEAMRRVEGDLAVVRQEAADARGRWGPLADALLAHVEAEAGRLGEDAGMRVVAWDAAARGWEAIDRPYLAAIARHRLAEARLANGESRTAIGEALRPAAATAGRLGARPLLDRVRRLARLARVELHATDGADDSPGGPATQAMADAADPLATLGLTPREREIMRRVAAGWSNARIAEDLGISVSTASVHVSNILAKLDVENRVEAAALAHRLGVVAADPDEPDAARSTSASG